MNRRAGDIDTNGNAWQLRGSKSTLVECRIRQTPSKLYAMTVVSGVETFLNEMYPDSTSAMRRALQVRDQLLRSGNWTTVSDQPASGRRVS